MTIMITNKEEIGERLGGNMDAPQTHLNMTHSLYALYETLPDECATGIFSGTMAKATSSI